MKKLLFLLALLLAAPSAHAANETIAGFPPQTAIGTADLLPFWQTSSGTTNNITGTNAVSSFFQIGMPIINSICSISGMPAVCGSFFNFVMPQWYGGYCDSNWNVNNNVHDDAPATQTALPSGYPVFIQKCKFATNVAYQGQAELLFSNTTTYLNDTFGAFPSGPTGQIFLPSNLSTTGKNCGIDFAGHNDIGVYGLNVRGNYDANGSAGFCQTNANADSTGTTFVYMNYVSSQNVGMGFGGPTDSHGVPQTTGGNPSVGYYGGNIQLILQHFTFAHAAWGMRTNNTDSHIHDGYIANTIVALSSFNQYGYGNSLNELRVEFNGGNSDFGSVVPSTIGTSAIYPAGAAPVTGVTYFGGAVSDMTGIQFENNSAPNIDLEGGAHVAYTGGHVFSTGNGGAASGCDANFYIGTGSLGGGSLFVSGVTFGTDAGHPAYLVCGGTTGSKVSITGSEGTSFTTSAFNFTGGTPTELDFQNIDYNRQYNGYNTGINIGTAAPLSTYDIGGNIAIGTGYAGVTAAPLNGAIIQGNVGIGTATPLSALDVNGGIGMESGTGGAVLCLTSTVPHVLGHCTGSASCTSTCTCTCTAN